MSPLMSSGEIVTSLPPRGAWIEIPVLSGFGSRLSWSLPPRGAWIEIYLMLLYHFSRIVAPPTGSVD